MDDFNNWMILIGNFGFPVLVAVYLLVRLEKKLESLTKEIIKLSKIIDSKE